MDENKLQSINIPDKVKKSIADNLLKTSEKLNHNFQWGVVLAYDEENASRIKVRIPILDDSFFKSKNIEDDIKKLPWCVPANKRIVETPEIGSVVLVGLFSIQDIFNGRIWFDVVDFVDSNVPDDDVKRLDVSPTGKKGWEEMEKLIKRKYNVAPGVRNGEEYKTKKQKANKRVLVKGKSKNALIFDEKTSKLIQNKGDKEESYIEVSKDVDISSSDHIKILSKKSTRKEKPIFAQNFLDLFQKVLDFNQLLVQLLSAGAGNTTTHGSPITPSSQVPSLLQKQISLQTEFEKFKQQGISNNIDIN